MVSVRKSFGLLTAYFILALCFACGQSNQMTESKEESSPIIIRESTEGDMKGFAVLELFTSEGCSSCPPADRLLRDMIADSQEKNLAVYALSFHVDYWNRLGWKDPYSSASFSQRQRNYAAALGSNVYTPQLVVNGKDEFVGSNRAKAAMAVKKALSRPQLDLKLNFDAKLLGDQLIYSYKTDKKAEQLLLNIALVESGLSQDVNRGENRGRVLKHDNVVRAFDTIEIDGMMDRGKLAVPEGLNLSQASVIFYVQSKRSKEVVLAKSFALGSPDSLEE